MAVQVPSEVQRMKERLQQLLRKAHEIRKSNDIEPPLSVSEFVGPGPVLGDEGAKAPNRHYIIETAARELAHELISSTKIDSPEFVQMWNLLDILLICGDRLECATSLTFSLIEDMLDSQQIAECRKIFDYLESRRERLVSRPEDLAANRAVILRSCNLLLRRLSRAEDAVLCGRIFLFLFQVFPLGDKSAVNPKGFFNMDNVTTFDEQPADKDSMDLDSKPDGDPSKPVPNQTAVSASEDTSKPTDEVSEAPKAATDDTETGLDLDSLYPVFWSLQRVFSNPSKLYAPEGFQSFKSGLEKTIAKFKQVPKVIQSRNAEMKRGSKRKHDGTPLQMEMNFNPKYLTSRELFQLELSDLAFQRHIMVQALILIDFLLSLTEKSKKRLAAHTRGASLKYDYTLTETDAEWAQTMRNRIAAYIREGPDGAFFYRMVDTVISRDKNWVRWKADGCPYISKDPTPAADYLEADIGVHKICTNKKLRATPMGSLDLSFLEDTGRQNTLEDLRDPARFSLPSLETLHKGIEGDDLDLEMATTEEEKAALRESKSSKTWKALRLAAKDRLHAFEKIEDGKDLRVLLESGIGDEPGGDAGSAMDSAMDNKAEDSPVDQAAPADGQEPEMQNGAVAEAVVD